MVSSRRFALRLAGRVVLVLVAAGAAAGLVAFGHAPTAALVALAATLVATQALWRVVNRGNAELARFVTALERIDLGQSFRGDGQGTGFERLGSAYEAALERLRAERASGAGAARVAEALVDGAPTPLLVLGTSGGRGDEVRFANKAARRLFGRSEPCPIAALAPFGPPFVAALTEAAPGSTRLSHLMLDGLSQRITIDTTLAEVAGSVRRIVAIKIIQVELDGAELAAQIDLVRVLTHEVMNSLTPVTSLAATASRLIGGLDAGASPAIADAQVAVEALARRATELERFVTSYKGFSDAPVLHRAALPVEAWVGQLVGLFRTTPAAEGVALSWSVERATPAIDGDAALLTQVMLNLMKNAAEAAASSPRPMVEVVAGLAADGRIKVAVLDNGPGIPADLSRDVFLPFFTTKPAGTGIGLSFARQIVMLHGGQIGIAGGERGGLEMLLPARGAQAGG